MKLLARHAKLRKFIALIFVIGIFGGGIGALIYFIDFPVRRVTITIDFGSPTSKTVQPVWNTINIWDVSFLRGDFGEFIADRYFEKNFYVDHLNIMTASGGRSTLSNEYYHKNPDGSATYNFTALMLALDWVIAANKTATIVIGNTPLQMCDDDPIDFGVFDANIGVPNNYTNYFWYIANLTHAVVIHTGIEIDRFEWRIMTEPDNHEWLRNEINDYFPIYITSFRAIRAMLPNATIEMGNFAKTDVEEALIPFLQKLVAEAPDTLPDIIGYSGYGRGQFKTNPREIGESGRLWYEAWRKVVGTRPVRVMIEEGQILSDEEGIRLWNGDGTEFGAAWNAGVFHECIMNDIDRYAQWGFHAGEVRGPSANVVEMYMKIQNQQIVHTSVDYDWWVKNRQQRLNAFATVTEDAINGSIMLYFSDPDHYSRQKYRVQIECINVPKGWNWNSPGLFLVDRTHSNFFWDQFAVFGQYKRGYYAGPTSVWDLNVGITLHETGHEAEWWSWSWEHRNDYQLEAVPSPNWIQTGTGYTLTLDVDANSVRLWQF
jgi:hypothetical protein